MKDKIKIEEVARKLKIAPIQIWILIRQRKVEFKSHNKTTHVSLNSVLTYYSTRKAQWDIQRLNYEMAQNRKV